jgi:DNA-binding response OmpR family regulator
MREFPASLLDRLVSDRTTLYLQKPFAPEDLARRVRAVLDADR